MRNEVQSVFLQSLERYLVNHCDEKLNEINSLFASYGFNQSFNENDLKDRNLFAFKVKILCSADEYNISPDEIIDKLSLDPKLPFVNIIHEYNECLKSLDRSKDFYYKNLDDSEFCVDEDLDSLFDFHLFKEPEEILNSPKDFNDFAKAFFVYNQDYAWHMSSEVQSVDEAKDYLKNVLQNIVDHREYQEKVFKPIYDFLLDQKLPEQQSKQVLHKLQVMGGTCNDTGYELINRLIKNACEFSRREIPDPVNQALEFYYGKKIDYIDSSKEKKIENSIRIYLEDPELFIDKFNQLSDLQKVEFHDKIEKSKGWRGLPFVGMPCTDGSYVSSLTELDIPFHAKKVDEWLNSQIADYFEGNDNAISFEHLVYQSLKENYIPNLDKTENIIVENKVQNQKSVNKTGYHR